jgi:hypothetical protein
VTTVVPGEQQLAASPSLALAGQVGDGGGPPSRRTPSNWPHGDQDGDDEECPDAASAKSEAPPYGSIDGAAVLDRVEAWYRRFIRVTFDSDYHLLALWTVHTHLAEECYTTPRLQLDSLVEGAGKTTVLDHLKRLGHDPVQIATLSSPALLPRLLHKGMRTILLDEVHRTLRSDIPGVGDLLAIINTGYRRGATRPVNVPVKNGGWEAADMPTFAPVAMAGNNPNLENDTRSRMIRVLLMPDLDGSVEDSDWEYLEDEANALQDEIALWAASASETVKGMHVDLPAGCVGRSKEKWRPLKRIAVGAGGRWPKIADDLIENGLGEDAAAREAGLKQQPPGMVLLTDLYAVWPKGRDFMPTLELVDLLVAHNPGYWGQDSPYGKRLTETRLGRMVNQATNSTSTRPDSHGPRGYTLSTIQMAWTRMGIDQTKTHMPRTDLENSANPANPERESDESELECSGLAESAGCSGLHETPSPPSQSCDANRDGPPLADDRTNIRDFDAIRFFDAIRVKLGVPLEAPTLNGNGEDSAAVLDIESNPVPPGGLTNSTPGQSDRVRRAVANARAANASAATNGQPTGADLTVEHDAQPEHEAFQHD